jgi:hypothetical protein
MTIEHWPISGVTLKLGATLVDTNTRLIQAANWRILGHCTNRLYANRNPWPRKALILRPLGTTFGIKRCGMVDCCRGIYCRRLQRAAHLTHQHTNAITVPRTGLVEIIATSCVGTGADCGKKDCKLQLETIHRRTHPSSQRSNMGVILMLRSERG